MPASAFASALPDVCDSASETALEPRFAALIVASRDGREVRGADWLALCRTAAKGIESITREGAVLNLGFGEEQEALATMYTLVQRLARLGLRTRVGVGPSRCVAQLAALTAPERGVISVAPGEIAALLYNTPVAALARLQPSGPISREEIEQMERFGLRTFGLVARAGELALRRQFGDAAGRFLAATCSGVDLRTLQASASPEQIQLRLHFAVPLSPARALAEIAALAQQAADRLRHERRQLRTLRLAGHWERGVVSREEAQLHDPTADPHLLTQEMARLLLRWIRPGASRRRRIATGRLIEVRLTLCDLVAAETEQGTLWPLAPQTPMQRRATLIELADTLAQRYGRPILLTMRLARPYAIFPEERYALAPLTAETVPMPAVPRPRNTAAPALHPGASWSLMAATGGR